MAHAPAETTRPINPAAAEHYARCQVAAVLHVLRATCDALGSLEATFDQFPFLAGYWEQLPAVEFDALDLDRALQQAVQGLDAYATAAAKNGVHLPLAALGHANGFDAVDLTLLATLGLIEEDARFAAVFEAFHGIPGEHRPTVGLLNTWWPSTTANTANIANTANTDTPDARARLRRLLALGIVDVVNPANVRSEWALQVNPLVWDAMRGEAHLTGAPWLQYRPHSMLPTPADLVLPDSLRTRTAAVCPLLAGGEARALVVRGPANNGRRTICAAVAQGLALGVLEIAGLGGPDDLRWRSVGSLATMLRALPVLRFDPAPGESVDIPPLLGYDGPLAVVLGPSGGLRGVHVDQAVTLTVGMPAAPERRRHWEAVLGPATAPEPIDTFTARYRMTSGNIRRVARLGQSFAALEGHTDLRPADVQAAHRLLNRQALELLATPLDPLSARGPDAWDRLALRREVLAELHHLASRCRQRERLQASAGPALRSQVSGGVRALLSGPSGTGKTLAARVLAAALEMDIYRLDLAAVVNKYIGETEKNLAQLFARAEELDVVLLLDEGDSLLANRTSVGNATDRYANLETNYLLQRLEHYEGILLITTNAADQIDRAFLRRMDVIVELGAPDHEQRSRIWQLHLPPAHMVDREFLAQVSMRCALHGGQIRNAALHATLLALENGGIVTTEYLEMAVQREYRKQGAICPLRTR